MTMVACPRSHSKSRTSWDPGAELRSLAARYVKARTAELSRYAAYTDPLGRGDAARLQGRERAYEAGIDRRVDVARELLAALRDQGLAGVQIGTMLLLDVARTPEPFERTGSIEGVDSPDCEDADSAILAVDLRKVSVLPLAAL